MSQFNASATTTSTLLDISKSSKYVSDSDTDDEDSSQTNPYLPLASFFTEDESYAVASLPGGSPRVKLNKKGYPTTAGKQPRKEFLERMITTTPKTQQHEIIKKKEKELLSCQKRKCSCMQHVLRTGEGITRFEEK